MASRRKPKGYKQGGAVIPDDEIAVMPEEAGADVPLAPEAPPAHDDAVQRILQATLHADELQRAAPPPPRTVDEQIDRMQLSERKKAMLREFPEALTDQFTSQAMRHHWRQALQSGIKDDTDDMDAAIRSGLAFEQARRHDRNAAMVPPSMPEPAPRRPSMPVSAPVSRQVPMISGSFSGQRELGQITLSQAEREIARNSFGSAPGAPDLTNAQKERLYAENKARLLAMRQSGEYRYTTEEGG